MHHPRAEAARRGDALVPELQLRDDLVRERARHDEAGVACADDSTTGFSTNCKDGGSGWRKGEVSFDAATPAMQSGNADAECNMRHTVCHTQQLSGEKLRIAHRWRSPG